LSKTNIFNYYKLRRSNIINWKFIVDSCNIYIIWYDSCSLIRNNKGSWSSKFRIILHIILLLHCWNSLSTLFGFYLEFKS
jgi:hypothetical protein